MLKTKINKKLDFYTPVLGKNKCQLEATTALLSSLT